MNSIIVLLLYFPFAGSVSRFLLFGTYIIIFALPLSRIKIKSLLPLGLLIGFSIIFPAFNFFKTHTIYEISEFTFSYEGFNTVDFDAYQMLMESINYVEFEGFLNFKNIITSFLFFVPRGIWSGKLEHSGVLISSYYGAYFTNLSCPYIAEFYLAFGFFGVIIGSGFLGYIIKVLDNWLFSKNMIKISISSIVLGMFIYLLRGAMLPTLAYTFALIISFILCFIIVFITNKDNFNKKIIMIRK